MKINQRNCVRAALLGLAVLWASRPTQAQEPWFPPPPPPSAAPAASTAVPAPPPPPPALPPQTTYFPAQDYDRPVAVELNSEVPGVHYEVYAPRTKPGRDAPVATCPGPCVLHLQPGDYTFHVSETDSTLAGNRKIRIQSSTSILFDPDTRAKRTVGLIFGIGGPLTILVGFGLALSAQCFDCPKAEKDEGRVTTGAALILGGLALTGAGWAMFGTSFKPEYDLRRGPAPRATAPTKPLWSVGVVPTSGGAAFAGEVRF